MSKKKLYALTAKDNGQSKISRLDIIPIEVVFTELYLHLKNIPSMQQVYEECLGRVEGYDDEICETEYGFAEKTNLGEDSSSLETVSEEMIFDEMVPDETISDEKISCMELQSQLIFGDNDEVDSSRCWSCSELMQAVYYIYPYLVRRISLIEHFNKVKDLKVLDIGKDYLYKPTYTHLCYKNKEYWIRLYDCSEHECLKIDRTQKETTFSGISIYHVAIPISTCTQFYKNISVYDDSHINYILNEILLIG